MLEKAFGKNVMSKPRFYNWYKCFQMAVKTLQMRKGLDILPHETKTKSSQWKISEKARPKNACQVRSTLKILLTIFFDFNRIDYYKFLLPDHTANKEYYLEVFIFTG